MPGQDHDRADRTSARRCTSVASRMSRPEHCTAGGRLASGNAATLAGGQSMTWAMPVREDQARASACDYDGTVVHDGQLDEETMAEPVRLADIGRKLLLVTGRELGDLLKVFLTAGAGRAGRG
jgi:hypothetical protein